jgi:hypothetical protein
LRRLRTSSKYKHYWLVSGPPARLLDKKIRVSPKARCVKSNGKQNAGFGLLLVVSVIVNADTRT